MNDVVDITRTTQDRQSDLQVVDIDARVGVANRRNRTGQNDQALRSQNNP